MQDRAFLFTRAVPKFRPDLAVMRCSHARKVPGPADGRTRGPWARISPSYVYSAHLPTRISPCITPSRPRLATTPLSPPDGLLHRPWLDLRLLHRVEEDFVRRLRLIALPALAPVIRDRVGEEAAGGREFRRGYGAVAAREVLKPLLRILIPEVLRARWCCGEDVCVRACVYACAMLLSGRALTTAMFQIMPPW